RPAAYLATDRHLYISYLPAVNPLFLFDLDNFTEPGECLVSGCFPEAAHFYIISPAGFQGFFCSFCLQC
ncbi:MAG: hypothetical protein ACSW8A_10920, partial [Lachnospiraceae bacterium]